MRKTYVIHMIRGVLLLPLLISCGTNTPVTFPDSVTFRQEKATHILLSNGRLIDLDPPLSINRMKIFDTLLIATGKSTVNEYGVHLYSKNSGKLLASCALMGRGPNENLNIFNFQLIRESRQFFFFDIMARRAQLYSIDKVLAENNAAPEETILFGKSIFDPLLRIGENEYICKNSLIKPAPDDRVMLSKVSLPDFTTITRCFFPDYWALPENIWYSQLSSIFHSNYSLSGTGEFIVLSYYRTDMLEVYDKNLLIKTRVQGPDQFFPAFGFASPYTSSGKTGSAQSRIEGPSSPMDNVLWPEGVARFGYELCYAAKNGFYASYNGAFRGGGARTFAENIYLFQYDGKPVSRYTFDIGGFGVFTVDENENSIYLIDKLGEIRVYNLK